MVGDDECAKIGDRHRHGNVTEISNALSDPGIGKTRINFTIELADNLGRELLEETGIATAELAAAPGWTMVRDGCYLGLLKDLTAPQSAAELRERMLRHNASEPQPEFADVRIVRGPQDFHPRMPPFMIAYLERVWRL